MDNNTVFLTGRLTNDPETSFSKDGKPISKFSIANNRGFNTNKKVNFFNCVSFGNTALYVEKYLKKGNRVIIEGSLDFNEWQDKAGKKMHTIKIIANSVSGIDSFKKDEQTVNNKSNETENDPYQGQDCNDPWA